MRFGVNKTTKAKIFVNFLIKLYDPIFRPHINTFQIKVNTKTYTLFSILLANAFLREARTAFKNKQKNNELYSI